jgi:YegS/Rv2252/BmrU family lipid kinase
MKSKTAYLIINPRLGKNVAKLGDILALFSAAGWKTDIALKEFGGHTMQLAREAAEEDYDLVIGYGGDGTLNQVVNGVMAAKRRRSVVGVIPGGTANVWAHEIGVPEDPVKAALFLINSEGRKVDLGHIEVDSVDLPRHHFLLMAGLGIDAAIMRRVSTPLKERIGEAAVALAAVKELPSLHSFPIEIRSSGAARGEGMLWKGEALQVIVGNTRRYGNVTEATPEARIDDGMLDVCIITAGAPLTTLAQILSTLLHRERVHGRSEYFQGAHFWISVPTSVHLHLDGSRTKLEDYSAGRVTYRFDAMPLALRVAIPHTYNEELFEGASGDGRAVAAEPRSPDQDAVSGEVRDLGQEHRGGKEEIDALLEHGRKVTVVGVGPNPDREGTWIVAGQVSDKKTGESKPVAVRIDHDTTLFTPAGEPLSPAVAAELPEGSEIVVDGKKSKREVIRAKRVVVLSEDR